MPLKSLCHADAVLKPAGGAVAAYHDAKHRVFLRMYEDFTASREIMARVPPG